MNFGRSIVFKILDCIIGPLFRFFISIPFFIAMAMVSLPAVLVRCAVIMLVFLVPAAYFRSLGIVGLGISACLGVWAHETVDTCKRFPNK